MCVCPVVVVLPLFVCCGRLLLSLVVVPRLLLVVVVAFRCLSPLLLVVVVFRCGSAAVLVVLVCSSCLVLSRPRSLSLSWPLDLGLSAYDLPSAAQAVQEPLWHGICPRGLPCLYVHFH